MRLTRFGKKRVVPKPGEIMFDRLDIPDINVYPVVNTLARTFTLSIYRERDNEYAGDAVCFDYDICDPENGDTENEDIIIKNIVSLLNYLNKEGKINLMISEAQNNSEIYSYSLLKSYMMKSMMCYFREKDFKFKVYGEPRTYVSNLIENLLRGLTSTSKRYYVGIGENDSLFLHDGMYKGVLTDKDMVLFKDILSESEKGSICVSKMDSMIDIIKNKLNNKKGECNEMVENKLTVEVKERIKAVLQNKVVWDLLAEGLTDGTVTTMVTESLKMELQEYEILLINVETGDVLESYATVERALDEDRIFKFIEDCSKLSVVIDKKGTIFLDGNAFDSDAVGLWTDGTKFLYLERYTNELILSKNKKDEIECINSIDLIDFEHCGEEYSNKFNKKLYENLRNTLLSEENKVFLEEVIAFLDTDEKLDRLKLSEISRKISLAGLKSFESIGKYYIATIVEEICSSRSVDLTFILTEDKVMVLICRADKLDVVRDIELDPTFAENDTFDVEFIEKLLVQVDNIKAEVLEEK